ncbi:MAG: DoxX family membrane protein [Opitutaceae bacterium]|nr:DoxX family membrane protein [Opitutaceae bacterium]
MSTDSAPKSFTRFFPVIARVLLGLVFFVFGLNGFLWFIPQPPADQMPKALVDFSTAMMNTGFLFQLVKGTEVAMGLLLLMNRFVPLALVVLAPVIVNIVLVHVLLAPSGTAMAVVILGLELYLAWAYRSAFRPLVAARATPG